MHTTFPEHAIAAATSEHAQEYYLQKLQASPLYYDNSLACWVVLSAALTQQVLSHPACRVRPDNLPVPATLNGRPSARFFAGLMRMQDGQAQQLSKQLTVHCLSAISPQDIEQACQLAQWQLKTESEHDLLATPSSLNQWISAFPLYSLANLIGLHDTVRVRLPELLQALVACLSPLSSDKELDQADLAFTSLFEFMQTQFANDMTNPVLASLRQLKQQVGWQDQTILLINLCGWFSQSYDACRGLLASSLLRLREQPALGAVILQQPAYPGLFLHEVCRLDSPIQNTRRYTQQAINLAGQDIPANQQILLLLAAANLDASTPQGTSRFAPQTQGSPIYTFGYGAHQCPGQNLALQFAQHALRVLTEQNAWQVFAGYRYQASVNARIALFH